ncbi:MAG: ribbon-helix-helix protein, CopG family [Alphaproteobacteria bacterium]|nr:ribbon-helix-helix protein, CopG family [Alphaproteobacteria bacterium]
MRNISLRMEDEDIEKLEKFAKMQDRDRSYMINKAVKHLIAEEERILAEIQEGLDDIEAGRYRSYEEFKKDMDEYIKNVK